MTDVEFPATGEGFVLTNHQNVHDVDRSRAFYQNVLGATVLVQKDPCILKFSNSWIVLAGGAARPRTIRAL
jgi:catechol 2,3-dioxygenase-like lactoylglutathione lyase family enzyme